MEIRKTFKFEMAHIVRKAWSTRCSRNIHGHSYIAEVFFSSNGDIPLRNGGMVIDFGLIKKYGNDFIDSFDHSLCLWDLPEEKELIEFAKANFERVIITPFPTSAEMQSIMFYQFFVDLLYHLKRADMCSSDVCVSRVIIHETATGKAQCDCWPTQKNQIELGDIWFSAGIKKDWTSDYTRLILGED